jgi:protease PrsW
MMLATISPAQYALAFLPVVAFLVGLLLLDTFKLVPKRRIVAALLAGALAAFASYVINSAAISMSKMGLLSFSILIAPLIEEPLKAVYVVFAQSTRRTGFLIDGAILGFASGAGFSIVENLYYLNQIPDAPMLVWIIRGFGTAVMHGATTGILAVLLRYLYELHGYASWRLWVPVIFVPAICHATFNRFMSNPILATVVVLILLPVLMRQVYIHGEIQLRRWLGHGFDLDSELLDLINSGHVATSPLGKYLSSLKESFPAYRVADMLVLLKLQTELSIRAKGMLILREHGFKQQVDPELKAKLEEVRWLEKTIGRAGILAMRPVCRWTGKNQWQRFLLEETD